MRIVTSLLILFCTTLFGKDYGFIVPPKNWDLAHPENNRGHVKVVFLKQTEKELPAHINLAIEENVTSLNEYVEWVKKTHEADPNNRWRDLGKFQTSAGEARLTEIDTRSSFGPVRQLQLLLVKNNIAYIITTSALKEEFSKFYQDFQSVFRSLTVTEDLSAALPTSEKRQALQELCKKLNAENWIEFQNTIIHDFSDLGPFWQALMIQSQLEKIEKDKT